MSRKYQIAFATGSRADYGIVRNYLKKLNNNSDLELKILVTGALLDARYGNAVSIIEQDGFDIECRMDLELDSSKNCNVINSMAIALKKFGYFFEDRSYDLLIILGDRYEMMSVAIAAAMQKIPILHLHGGEATFSNYDEFIRHSITKMSRYHFTSTEEYRKRVIQLGENPETVFNLGALGAENCLNIDLNNVPLDVIEYKNREYFCVLFHPETLSNESTETQILNLLNAVSRFVNRYVFVFIGSNADTASQIIREKIQRFCENNKNVSRYENLHPDAYHFLVRHSRALIGNSSSGIIEAPSLGTYTINIGHRQDGRVRGNSVIDVSCNEEQICNAIQMVLNKKNQEVFINPYYKKDSAELYYSCTLNILKKQDVSCEPKIFYDIIQ